MRPSHWPVSSRKRMPPSPRPLRPPLSPRPLRLRAIGSLLPVGHPLLDRRHVGAQLRGDLLERRPLPPQPPRAFLTASVSLAAAGVGAEELALPGQLGRQLEPLAALLADAEALVGTDRLAELQPDPR